MSRVEAGGPYSVWLSMMETFSAAIYKTGINPCVDVPQRVTRAFGRRGYVRVKGSINRFTFRATLVPVGDGRHLLCVNGAMRKGAGIDVGDTIRRALEIDDAPREMPVPIDLARGLRQAGAWGAFQRARPSDRKDILAYHSFLKTPEARKRNVERVLEHLRRWGLLE